jgi:hypothetical protein
MYDMHLLSAKYALATTNKLIDIYGPNGMTGYDIGCLFSKTVAASSIADKVKRVNVKDRGTPGAYNLSEG